MLSSPCMHLAAFQSMSVANVRLCLQASYGMLSGPGGELPLVLMASVMSLLRIFQAALSVLSFGLAWAVRGFLLGRGASCLPWYPLLSGSCGSVFSQECSMPVSGGGWLNVRSQWCFNCCAISSAVVARWLSPCMAPIELEEDPGMSLLSLVRICVFFCWYS